MLERGRRSAASHVWITTKKFFCFHKNRFDEMLCKLDSIDYLKWKGPERGKFATQTRLAYENHCSKNQLKNLPLSEKFTKAERKRPGRGGIMLKKSIKEHHGNNIACIIESCLIQHNTLRFMFAQFALKSYSHTTTTQVTVPCLSLIHWTKGVVSTQLIA